MRFRPDPTVKSTFGPYVRQRIQETLDLVQIKTAQRGDNRPACAFVRCNRIFRIPGPLERRVGVQKTLRSGARQFFQHQVSRLFEVLLRQVVRSLGGHFFVGRMGHFGFDRRRFLIG